MQVKKYESIHNYVIVDIHPWPKDFPPEGTDLRPWYKYRDFLNARGIPAKEIKDGFRIMLFREVDPDSITIDLPRIHFTRQILEDQVLREISFRRTLKDKVLEVR